MSSKRAECIFNQEEFISRLSKVIGDESYRSYAQRGGFSDTMLRSYVKDSIPSIEKAAQICAAAKVDDSIDFSKFFSWLCLGIGGNESDFFDGLKKITDDVRHVVSTDQQPIPLANEDDDVVWINSLDVFASAGHGFINDQELGNKLPFSHRWLAENGLLGKRLSLIRVSGHSMDPTLRDKETPLIEILPDDAINRLAEDVYVIRMNGQLLIKRIQPHINGGYLVKSDNPRFDSFVLDPNNWPDDFKVIARWTGKKF